MSKEKATKRINDEIQRNGQNKKFSPLILIIPLIVIFIVIGVIFVISQEGKPKEKNMIVTPDNVEEIVASLEEQEKTPIGSYEVYMNTEWHFPDSSSESRDAIVENSITNNNTVFFTIELPDTKEEIYKSPYIPVGSSLESIVLDKELPAGSYKTVLTYHLVDDSYEEISNVSVNVTIIIEQ